MRYPIPMQFDPTQKSNVESVRQATKQAVEASLVGNAGIKLFLKGGMNQILSLIGFLNIVAHNTIINVNVPTNAQRFMSVLLPIISFDLINTAGLDEKIFDFGNDEPLN